MTEKINKDYFRKEEFEEEPKEEPKEEVKYTAQKPKSPVRVVNIINGELVLADSKGNAFRIPVGEEHKRAKIGDIIYL